MQKNIQALIAYTSAQLSSGWQATELIDKEGGERVRIDERAVGYRLYNHPFRDGCPANKSCDGLNHCLVDSANDRHICLSTYGKLFDGYDQESACHFSGMVYDDAVELYDYNESDFFRFERI